MKYKELFDKMLECRMISDYWRNMLSLIEKETKYKPSKEDDSDENRAMELLTVYCSLMEDGNVYMSLDRDILSAKIQDKISKLKIQFEEDEDSRDEVLNAIEVELSRLYENPSKIETLSIVGKEKLFIVEDNRLYTRKYYNAVRSISNSVKRLFKNNPANVSTFSYRKYVEDEYSLSKSQEEVLNKGYYNNLIITGGPGTGKTTSVFFLLLSLLIGRTDMMNVYLAAPSGKAASRMTDSIKKCAEEISDSSVIDKVDTIKTINGMTIHSLLGYNRSNGGFMYNVKKRFSEGSIFVIDEASMIDVCLFASLLEAIPDDSRIFILGDRNQLPSVECGAVFGDLILELPSDNIVELTESKRFSEDSEIFALADAINRGKELPIREADWNEANGFTVNNSKYEEKKIFYYRDQSSNNAEMIALVTNAWYEYYFKALQNLCSDMDIMDLNAYNNVNKCCENARILCANNRGTRGVENINRALLKKWFSTKNCVSGYYPGEMLMITRNIKQLDLNNGESGVAVKFKDDDMLYVMFNKHVSINIEEGKQYNDKIFKIGEFVFYPVSKIDREDITTAFAITIHKSQGSDYGNILVILPRLKGHPLLNRQLLYTAITRTKGDTYILSNQKNMECARDTVLSRDTGIEI